MRRRTVLGLVATYGMFAHASTRAATPPDIDAAKVKHIRLHVVLDRYATVLKQARLRLVVLDINGATVFQTADTDQAADWPQSSDGDFEVESFPLLSGGLLAIDVQVGKMRLKANCAMASQEGQVAFFVVHPLIEQGKRFESTETHSATQQVIRSESEPTELLVGIVITPSPDYPTVSG